MTLPGLQDKGIGAAGLRAAGANVPTGPDHSIQGSLLIVLSAAGFGAMAIFVKAAYAAGANVVTTLFLRFLIASMVLWLGLAASDRVRLRMTRRALWAGVGLGTIGYGMQSLSYFTALQHISASLAALLLYVYPLVVTLFAAVVLRERIDRRKTLALAAAAAGLLLILGRGSGTAEGTGVKLVLLSAGVFSAYIIMSRLTLRGVSPFASAAIVMPSACASFGLYGYLTGQLRFDLAPQAYAAILGIAVVSTVLAIVAFFAGLERVGASRAAILSTLEPVVTVALGAALLGERLTANQVAGGVCILGAAILLSGWAWGRSREGG